ncbi:MAG: hypothetical protein IJT83_13150 [Victivallales bacterium]|nr:hypothetical protein [Victivallales bacterium]
MGNTARSDGARCQDDGRHTWGMKLGHTWGIKPAACLGDFPRRSTRHPDLAL